MQTTERKVADYIKSLDAPDRPVIQTLVDMTQRIMPRLKPGLWEGKFWGGYDNSIIGFGKFLIKGKTREVEWFLIGITKQKNYFSVYVTATEGKDYLSKVYGKKLGKVKIGSSSISFTRLEDLNLDVWEEMLTKAYDLMKDKIHSKN